jgi:hypothetical protein
MPSEIEKELQSFTRETTPDGLGELGQLVKRMMESIKTVSELENKLSIAKAQLQAYRVDKIPPLMAELGIGELKTDTGLTITVDTYVGCKFFSELKADALKWLEEHDYGGIIKNEVSLKFGKDSEDEVKSAVNALRAAGFEPDVDKNVHPMTLKAWATRQVENGGEIPTNIFDFTTFQIAEVRQ